MYGFKEYFDKGVNFLHNQAFPSRKRLSYLMIYATDLCDSQCKHCLIWAKRPVKYLSKEKIVELISNSKCINRKTKIGLQGGEFVLHPEATEIMEWMRSNHPNFDLLSNCLQPKRLIEAVDAYPPERLWISLDGNEETYHYMRGKDGYRSVIHVIESLTEKVPISVMFTLSPYNDFSDLEHVAQVCKKYKIDLRIGIYNNIAFFDTIDTAHGQDIGSLKKKDALTLRSAHALQDSISPGMAESTNAFERIRDRLPDIVKEFAENYDFIALYDEWRRGNLQLGCHSIMDSLVLFPNGDVPICQHLDVLIGNIFTNSLDEIFNGPDAISAQKHHSQNCNACWINFHRKYDIVLYRNFERFFGAHVTGKLLGHYWWEKEKTRTYKQLLRS